MFMLMFWKSGESFWNSEIAYWAKHKNKRYNARVQKFEEDSNGLQFWFLKTS